jgi:hypothetical protein
MTSSCQVPSGHVRAGPCWCNGMPHFSPKGLSYAPLSGKQQLQGTQASHLRWSLPLCTRSQHPRTAQLAALSAQLAAPAAGDLVPCPAPLPGSAEAAALPVEPLAEPLIAAALELQPDAEFPPPVAEPLQPPLPPWPPSDTLPVAYRAAVDEYVSSALGLLSGVALGADAPAAAGELLRDVLRPATLMSDEGPARDAFMEVLSPFDTLGGSGFDEVCVEAQLLPRLQQRVSADLQRATGAVAVAVAVPGPPRGPVCPWPDPPGPARHASVRGHGGQGSAGPPGDSGGG